MKSGKIMISAALIFSLLCLTACGKAETGAQADTENNEVVVDFGNIVEESEAADNLVVSEVSEEVSQEVSSDEKTESDVSDDGLEWFDDCVFLGDSLINGLSNYNDMTFHLGNAQFICSSGLGYGSCQWDINDENEVHPYYYGEKILLEDGVELTGATKAIIGMGMNDIGNYGIDQTMEYVGSFVARLRERYPGLKIYLETVTPMIPDAQRDILNNALIVEFNDRLAQFCKENHCGFLNTWSALADENGELPFELCGDPEALGLHLTLEGDEIVSDYIIHNVVN